MKKKFVALLLIVLILSILTVALRSTLPKTFDQEEISVSDVTTKAVFLNLVNRSELDISNFSRDFGSWSIFDNSSGNILFVNNGLLCLNVSETLSHQVIVISRPLNISLLDFPVFSINISASTGVFYHIRFTGNDSAGVEKQVWWETSPFDDITGTSKWVIHSINLVNFSSQATGEDIAFLTSIQLVFDKPMNILGINYLDVSNIVFSHPAGLNIKVVDLPAKTQLFSGESFQAVIIDLPPKYEPKEGWVIKWASVGYTLMSDSEFEYLVFLGSNKDGLRWLAQGPSFISHKSNSSDIFTMYSRIGDWNSDVLKAVSPLLGNFSILIFKSSLDVHGFLSFELHSIEYLLSNVETSSNFVISSDNYFLFTLGLTLTVVIVPFVLLVVICLNSDAISKRSWLLFLFGVFGYGVLVRLLWAPFTGHLDDMGLWTQSVRMYYESGYVGAVDLYPMPFTYYSQLIAYSPYALFRSFGLNDVGFLSHVTRMVEAIFLKAPFIISDVVSVFLLVKIFKSFNLRGHGFAKQLGLALIYFLGPLVVVLSGVWGMYDGIAIALFLAGIYFGLVKEKFVLGILFFSLSGLTEVYGFMGILPILLITIKRRRFSLLPLLFGIVLGVVFLAYLPLYSSGGVQGVLGHFENFFKGRIGFGSQSTFIASDSYLSYLSLFGLNIGTSVLTSILIVVVVFVTVLYILKMRKLDIDLQKWKIVEFSLVYFAVVFLVFYLSFYRVFDQLYVWVLPVLLLISWFRDSPGIAVAAIALATVAAQIHQFGLLVVGADYSWIRLSLPADPAIIAVVPSTIVILTFLGILFDWGSLKILRTKRGMAVAICVAAWFSFGLAYYFYHGFPFLGPIWYIDSITIGLFAIYFFVKAFRTATKRIH